ncbi:PilZ domain-containing protein [Roseibium marinum]|uniref:PilZ domain-containing protein n=1 Tax=Roseibium marinum TaxID=281252 RepID=A0A2S3UX45_9HYPH|nr:PilZ domain-containing protein [Roseibium marinum]POF32295.1 PilZ domain-containing protein [Roseibium marinum]
MTMSDAKPEPQSFHPEEDPSDLLPRQRRARVFKKGKMIFQNGLRSIPCTVRNISEGGAMLQFEQAFLLPKEFDLQIELEDYEVTCERRWEDGLRCGVQFVGEKRHTSKQRAQVLKTSEEALKVEVNERTESLDNFFARKLAAEKPQQPGGSAQRTGPAGGGKPTFGKRR